MIVLRWDGKMFAGVVSFKPTDSGYADFATLVDNEVRQPVKLLIDILEEELQLETAPRLIGKDRRDFQRRLLNKHFRHFRYAQLLVQGREKTSRRDEKVLMSALSNPKLFKPWLDILQQKKIPLAGIYSLPLVGESLLSVLGAQQQNALLISQQVPSGIRQSFYAQGKLKLSRLAPSSDQGTEYYSILQDETARILRYLENQPYVDANKRLHIYLIAPEAQHAKLQQIFIDDTRKQYHRVAINQFARDLGIISTLPDDYAYWLFAQPLLKNNYRQQHYATPQERRYYRYFQINRGLRWLAAGALLFATVSGVWSWFDGYSISAQRSVMLTETARYERLYNDIINEFSALELQVSDVRTAVKLADALHAKYTASPLDSMRLLSQALSEHPRITITGLRWLHTDDINHTLGETKPSLDPRTERLVKMGRVNIYYEKALVKAKVVDYSDNPRIALEAVEQFVATLRRQNPEHRIDLIKLPFDIDPNSRLVGQGVNQSNRFREEGAEFSLLIIKATQV